MHFEGDEAAQNPAVVTTELASNQLVENRLKIEKAISYELGTNKGETLDDLIPDYYSAFKKLRPAPKFSHFWTKRPIL